MELINTLETPGEFDALRSLQPDEPYFLLLGRDRLAPKLVQQWADDNRTRARDEHQRNLIGDERLQRELRKSTEAEAIGWAMAAFKAGDMAKKVTGQPTAKYYTGHELPAEVQLRDKVQSTRVRAASAVNNAMAELNDAIEAMEAIEGDEYAGLIAQCGRLHNHMGMVSEALKPARPI